MAGREPFKYGGTCAVCGAGIQRYGPGKPWRHKRPAADGPHDHKAVAKKEVQRRCEMLNDSATVTGMKPTATITRTFEVTLAGRTEAVEFTGQSWDGNPVRVLNSAHGVFAARIGNGAKLYAAQASAWPVADAEQARKLGYRPSAIRTDAEGQMWVIKMGDTVRNRQAAITHWAEDFVGTTVAAAYDDYSGLR